MSNSTDKSILTSEGKALLAQLNAEENPLIIDKMIFAHVPSRPEFPQPDDTVPSEYVVHQEAVDQRGRLSKDSVIYTSTLNSDVGPFEFNWTGAYCSEYDVLVTIEHHALTPKTTDEPGVAGNTLVRSVVLEYKDIAEITNITVDASSWQYNATPRMKKMDDDVAQAIIDQNGKDWFIEDGFLVTPSGSAYNIKAGAGYVSGNRISMEFDRSVQVPNKPSFIYIDAYREGTVTGEQVTLFDFVISADEKDDYIDSSTGKDISHFVCKIAEVFSSGTVLDWRTQNQNASNKQLQSRTLKSIVFDGGADNSGQSDASDSFGIKGDYFVPDGLYKSSGDFPDGSYHFAANARFLDEGTDLPFKPCHNGQLQHLSDAFYDRMARTFTGWSPKIVCFGDSNTRYYEGEGGGAGPACKSYGQILSVLCGHYPSTFGADVVVSGHPGNTADWGAEEITNHVDSNSDIVVLGFGTNDVKLSDAINESDLDDYLSSMKTMLKYVLSIDATPIVLGIPWFSETYGHYDELSQKIIKVWNTYLYYLCQSANVPFIDTYNLTRKYDGVYFNESNVKRHYSQAATKAIAEKVITEVINCSQASKMPANLYSTFDFLPFVNSDVSTLEKKQYTLGHERFEAIEVLNGDSISINTFGLTCIGFYPRSNAKAAILENGITTEVEIINSTDKGLYYPIQRHVVGNPTLTGNGDSAVTISATEGDLYIRYFSFEAKPFSSSSKVNKGNQTPIYVDISAENLPLTGDESVIYRINELTNLPVYFKNSQWFGFDGLYAIGDNEKMNAVLGVGAANGKKFFNIEEGKAKRLFNGAWIDM